MLLLLLLLLLYSEVCYYWYGSVVACYCCYSCTWYVIATATAVLLLPLPHTAAVDETRRARLLAHPIPVFCDDAHHFAELLAHVQLVRVEDQKNQIRTFREPFHDLPRYIDINRIPDKIHAMDMHTAAFLRSKK